MLKLMSPWEEVKEKIKEINTELTNADLIDYEAGEEKKMLQHLAKKMNRSEDEIKAWIESVSSNQGKAS